MAVAAMRQTRENPYPFGEGKFGQVLVLPMLNPELTIS
jgi:hypothetical protein